VATPVVLHLHRRALARRDAVRTLVGGLGLRASARPEAVSVFAFKDDELAFARALAERTHLWVFRANQRAFAGDFVVVDVSSPRVEKRPAVVVDLKRGGRLREGRQGIQMRRTERAMAVLSERGVVGPACVPVYVYGDAAEVLAAMGELLAQSRASKRR
jgi:hypothetical protein